MTDCFVLLAIVSRNFEGRRVMGNAKMSSSDIVREVFWLVVAVVVLMVLVSFECPSFV